MLLLQLCDLPFPGTHLFLMPYRMVLKATGCGEKAVRCLQQCLQSIAKVDLHAKRNIQKEHANERLIVLKVLVLTDFLHIFCTLHPVSSA